jgi:hypothetical protein
MCFDVGFCQFNRQITLCAGSESSLVGVDVMMMMMTMMTPASITMVVMTSTPLQMPPTMSALPATA